MTLPKHDEKDLSIETDNDVKQRRLALHMRAYHGVWGAHDKGYFTLNREHKTEHKKASK